MRTRRAVALALVLVFAAAVRLVTWPRVFTEDGVRFVGDTDPHYHVLQAERLAQDGLGAVWFDPALDWPNGALVPWPPLFDAVLAGAGALSAGGSPWRPELEAAAAVVPPVLGVATVALSVLLAGALLGTEVGLLAALLLAGLTAHASVTLLGRPDQHALEVLLAGGLWLAFLRTWQAPPGPARPRAAAALGILVALAFWNWLGSAFTLAVPALAVAALHLAARPEAPAAARGLAAGSGLGAALLVVSIALLGAPGALARTSIVGVGGLHVAVTAGCAAFAWALARAPRLRRRPAGPARRGVELALALLVPATVELALSPGLREGVRRGLVAAGAADAWYATISEFQPLLLGSRSDLSYELAAAAGMFGLVVPAALCGAVPLVRRWREDPAARAGVLVAAAWAIALLGLTLARRRFAPYAALALAPPAAAGVRWLGELVSRRWRGASGWAPLGLAALALAPSALAARGVQELDVPTVDALTWLRGQPSPLDGRAGVAADWDLGHAIQYYAGKPVLTSPFGTEAGPRSMTDWAELAVSLDEAQAQELLARRRIGFLVLSDALTTVASVEGFLPPGVTPPVSVRFTRPGGGHDVSRIAELGRLVMVRLWEADGGTLMGEAPSLSGFRLIHETGVMTPSGPVPQKKVFGVVAGARLAIRARAGAPVRARVLVRTDSGRRIEWTNAAIADAGGRAVLRIPYASGANGTSRANPVELTDGATATAVLVSEEAVQLGLEVPVTLGRVAGAAGR